MCVLKLYVLRFMGRGDFLLLLHFCGKKMPE